MWTSANVRLDCVAADASPCILSWQHPHCSAAVTVPPGAMMQVCDMYDWPAVKSYDPWLATVPPDCPSMEAAVYYLEAEAHRRLVGQCNAGPPTAALAAGSNAAATPPGSPGSLDTITAPGSQGGRRKKGLPLPAGVALNKRVSVIMLRSKPWVSLLVERPYWRTTLHARGVPAAVCGLLSCTWRFKRLARRGHTNSISSHRTRLIRMHACTAVGHPCTGPHVVATKRLNRAY